MVIWFSFCLFLRVGLWSEHYWQDLLLVLWFSSPPLLDSGTAFGLMFFSYISRPHLVPFTYYNPVINGSLLYTARLY
jgi:hypothetical protein